MDSDRRETASARAEYTRCSGIATIILLAIGFAATAPARAQTPDFEGMWSDPPVTALDLICLFYCSDAGFDYMNALLDDPANDDRNYEELYLETMRYQAQDYIRSHMTPEALELFPWDPARDPGFLNCEPWGFLRQMFAAHQLDITQHDDRIEMHYGEWDGRRTIWLDGRQPAADEEHTSMGFSTGHYDGDALVIETSHVLANRTLWRAFHGDQLRVTERYTRDYEGGRLLLEAVLEDPWSLKEPLNMKKVWRWAPEEAIYPYADCHPPDDPSVLVTQP